MPAALTIFVAQYMVFIEVFVALCMFALVARTKSRLWLFRWAIAAVLILGLSYAFARVGAALYNDPRPFTQDHVKPLIAHAADNGFPSDHALLAAALVALLVVAGSWWSVSLVVFAILVDWARVGSGLHHVADVLGSSLFVLVATMIAVAMAPAIRDVVSPYLPLRQRDGAREPTGA